MLLGLFLELVRRHLKHLNDFIQEIRILSQRRSAIDIQRLLLVLGPNLIQNSWRVLEIVLAKLWVAFEVKLRYVRIRRLYHILFVILRGSSVSRGI